MKTGIILILFLFTLTFFKCSGDPVKPQDDELPDNTSHEFTWHKFTFGGAASSYLTDVAIINDTSIWAVGTIFINDSTGQVDPKIYNAVHWDGINWELKRIKYYGDCSAVEYPPLKAIYAFSENNIVVTNGGSMGWFDENTVNLDCGVNPLLTGAINKLWGTSSENLYAVGNKGNIAHYQNGVWYKIESGTELNINDVWGAIDKDGKEIVLCPAYNLGTGGEKKLLKIIDGVVEEIDWIENRELYTVWFKSLDKIYAGGEGLYLRENGMWKQEELPALFKFRVRGNGLNDIWTCGGFGFAAHFNGATWKEMEEATLSNGNYYSLDVKGNTIALVGSTDNSSLITIGKRQ